MKSLIFVFLVLSCTTVFSQYPFFDGRRIIENDTSSVFTSFGFGLLNRDHLNHSRPVAVNFKIKKDEPTPFFRPTGVLEFGAEFKRFVPGSLVAFRYELLMSPNHLESLGGVLFGRDSVFDFLSFRAGGFTGVYIDRVFSKTRHSASSELGQYETTNVFGPEIFLGFNFGRVGILGSERFVFSQDGHLHNRSSILLRIPSINTNFGFIYEKNLGFRIQKYFRFGIGISAQVFTAKYQLVSKGFGFTYSFD